MRTIGHILKEIREEKGHLLQEVQQVLDIDLTQLSKIENGKRLPTVEQLQKLAKFYNCDNKALIIQRESDKIVYSFEYPEFAIETLKVAEDKIKYGNQYIQLFQDTIYPKPISLESRRYIGSKAKLTDWIMDLIDKETENRMRKLDKIAKKNIDAKLYKEYYKLNFSSPFMRDTLKTSSSLSIKMGMKQVIGLVITEIWFAVKEDFENFSTSNSLKENFFQLKDTIEKEENIIISGDGGNGKTAILKEFYSKYYKEIPFCIFKATELNVNHINDIFYLEHKYTFVQFLNAYKDEPCKFSFFFCF